MPNDTNAKRRYTQLLKEQLRPGETLDGIFSSGPDVMVALTSDRLILISSSLPNGWSLKSIPWRLLTEKMPNASEDDALVETGTLQLRYTLPDNARHKSAPRTVDPDATSENEPKATQPIDLVLSLSSESDKIAALVRSHLPSAASV